MNESLDPIQHFTLPGGSLAISQAHIVRCICRRAERSVWVLHHEATLDTAIPIFLNRLSDYYFTLARYIAHIQGVNVPLWKP
jgi:cob(I)alamin adenosyltransferase